MQSLRDFISSLGRAIGPTIVSLAWIIVLLISVLIMLGVTVLILRRRNNVKQRRWTRLEQGWEPAILQVLVGAEDSESLWRKVEPRDRLYFVSFLLRYAQRLAGDERSKLDDLAAPFLKQIAARLKSRNVERRARAVKTLTILGLRTHARVVVEALDDPSPFVAMVAARSLANREHPEFAMEVLKRLHRFEHWRPSYLASMLASIGLAAAPAFRQTLADPLVSSRSRSVAADALLALHDFTAVAPAADALTTTRDRNLLVSLLRFLAELGGPEQLHAIRPHATSSDPVVRSRAIAALGRIGDPADRPVLLAAFQDPSPWVAIRAAEALWEAGDTALLKEVADSDHPRATLARQALAGDIT